MSEAEFVEILAAAPTAMLCSASSKVRTVGSSIAPLYRGAKLFGRAKTAWTRPGQNAAIHRAAHSARRGDVLVVAGGDGAFGYFGDILAACCRQQGVIGVVLDAAIRDVADIVSMRFPVFCLGACPAATAKTNPGKIDIDIQCGDALVSPGDYIAADDDGVVVIPRELARDVASRTGLVQDKEEAIKRRISGGATTCEIFEIPV